MDQIYIIWKVLLCVVLLESNKIKHNTLVNLQKNNRKGAETILQKKKISDNQSFWTILNKIPDVQTAINEIIKSHLEKKYQIQFSVYFSPFQTFNYIVFSIFRLVKCICLYGQNTLLLWWAKRRFYFKSRWNELKFCKDINHDFLRGI